MTLLTNSRQGHPQTSVGGHSDIIRVSWEVILEDFRLTLVRTGKMIAEKCNSNQILSNEDCHRRVNSVNDSDFSQLEITLKYMHEQKAING